MTESPLRSFASDNNAGASPEIMEALLACNRGHAVGYGDDPWTRRAEAAVEAEFGAGSKAFFVLNGTGANVLGLSLCAGPGQSVLCAAGAHIDVDETGAPEAAGIKLVAIPSPDGKLRPGQVEEALAPLGVVHHAQPAVISISQPTELGVLYSPHEIATLASLAHGKGLLLHMDGARIANAAAALDLPFKALTRDLGVDVLSFGGMKNGVAFGEVLVVLNPGLAARAPYLRKTRLQLASKMRFIAAQYEAYLRDGLWLRNARAANAAARQLAAAIRNAPGLALEREPEVNALFCRLPDGAAELLRRDFFFYDWEGGLVRFMTSFDTSTADIEEFSRATRDACVETWRA